MFLKVNLLKKACLPEEWYVVASAVKTTTTVRTEQPEGDGRA